MARRLLLFTTLAVLSACSTPPPTAWLRYEAADPNGWMLEGDGRLSVTLLGARLLVDLHQQQTRVELIVENGTTQDLEVRVGPEATRAPTAAIGELLRRPLDRGHGEEVPEFVPYLSMQRAEVRANWRGVFDLDSPLGREPTIGQYLVLVIEVRDGKGGFERRLLPLVATNAGTSGARHAARRS